MKLNICVISSRQFLRKYILNILCILMISLSISCSTIPKFSSEAKMCCVVLNEKNEPISGCVGILKKNGAVIGKNISDERGYLIFDNVKSGDYGVLIRKEGFEEKEYDKIGFYNRGKINCFQVKSKDCLFDEIELLFDEKKYDEAIEVLDTVYFTEKSCVEVLVKLYRIKAFIEMGEKKLALDEFDELKKIEMELEKSFFDYSCFETILEVL